ncbi:uncharacterized protein LOC131670173 [Phymastichus coffea]|uniref:uncharacterized protein LOC131670173 n=1 Tax=Phymastichus coffea TaxID=108790 RepID=UPI00273AD442|nr:uncharacterized protein LOC131670173 [Phymastichus coffea]
MYRQIWVHPDDRKFQKILWYHEGEVRTIVLNVVTFGVKCAPFLAVRTLHQLAVDEESRFPKSECWKANITWDESLPQDIHTKWIALAEQLLLVREVALPRYLRYDIANPVSTEIHGFCDASIQGYGACIFIRSIDSVGNVTLTFTIVQTILRTDSKIVLCWLDKAPHLLRTYEVNRVADIQTLGEKVEWKHVRSKDNPADSLSRRQLPRKLLADPLWNSGPPWLVLSQDQWPPSESSSSVDPPGATEGIVLFTASSGSNVYARFSDYECLIRSIRYLLRWHRKEPLPDDIQGADKSLLGIRYLSQIEIAHAERTILLLIQRECFSHEMKLLKSTTKLISKGPNGAFRSRMKFDELNPFLDEHGLIRVGGRLKNSNLQFNQKYPILLPSNHNVSDLIIRDAHHRNLHGRVQCTLYTIRERFWILNGRNQIRHVLRRCVPCLRQKPKFSHTKIADLPESRVNPAFAFAKTGVDFFGPIMIKEKKDRNRSFLKAYASVFVCMATKAVHIEVASDLSAKGFLACFRRFIATHGKPSTMHSDNGTNFVGANNELQKIYKLHDSPEFKDAIQTFAASERIEWNFNPPLSPYFGGLWEAAVKSFKHHLNRVVKDQKLTYEQLETLLKEIAAVLNSRPLYAISADPNDSLAITPAHFLIGHPFNFLPEQNYVSVPNNRLTSYQLVSKARQAFWSKWLKEYLHELQTRQK